MYIIPHLHEGGKFSIVFNIKFIKAQTPEFKQFCAFKNDKYRKLGRDTIFSEIFTFLSVIVSYNNMF